MNRIDLHNSFKNIQMIFIVSHATWYLLDDPTAIKLLDNFIQKFKDGPRTFTKVFENPKMLEHALKEFRRGAMRAVISETWELTDNY